jgi:hypothetical protein
MLRPAIVPLFLAATRIMTSHVGKECTAVTMPVFSPDKTILRITFTP